MSHGRKKCCDWLTSYSHRGTRQLIGMWGMGIEPNGFVTFHAVFDGFPNGFLSCVSKAL